MGRHRQGNSTHYFVNRCWVGFASAVGAAGEIANVSQVFQPDGRLAASNSPYPLKPRKPCMPPTGENISDLRPDAENARPETAQSRRLTKIVGDLLIGVSDHACEKLLGEEVRRGPVEMEIDTALVLRVLVLEIVGEAGNAREFVAARRIKVGVAAADVDRPVTLVVRNSVAFLAASLTETSRS
jgi:hypothetical protein